MVETEQTVLLNNGAGAHAVGRSADYSLMRHHPRVIGDEEGSVATSHAEKHFESPRIVSDIIIGFRYANPQL